MGKRMKFETRERVYIDDGYVYLLRDVRVDDRFVRVEYGTRLEDGTVKWMPTHEGVEFKHSQPLIGSRIDY
jgi:hypothetical protein